MITDINDFEEELFQLIAKHSHNAPIDLIKSLEGMKYNLFISVEMFRNAKKYPLKRHLQN